MSDFIQSVRSPPRCASPFFHVLSCVPGCWEAWSPPYPTTQLHDSIHVPWLCPTPPHPTPSWNSLLPWFLVYERASQVALVVKNPPANAGDLRDAGFTPESEWSSGGGHRNPLQYYCLENPMNRGAWWATVHRVTKSQTRMKPLSTQHITLSST